MNNEVPSTISESKEFNQKSGDMKFSNKEFLERLDLFRKMLSGIAIAAGILLVSCYCIHINFYPKGLTVGDTIVFLFAILSFGMLDVLGVLYCAVAMYWTVDITFRIIDRVQQNSALKRGESFEPIKRKKLIGEKFTFFISFIVFLIAATTLFDVGDRQKITAEEWRLLGSFLTGGYLLIVVFAFESPRELNARDKKIKNVLIPIFAFFLPLFMGTLGTLLDKTMSLAELRVMNHPIRLSKQNFETVAGYAKKFNVPIQDCGEESNGDHIVEGVDILWHGIGELAKLQIGDRSDKTARPSSPYVAFAIKDVDIYPIWASVNPCQSSVESPK